MDVFTYLDSRGMRPSVFADKLGIGVQSIERLLRSMEFIPETQCWRWTGALRKGYGAVHFRSLGGVKQVHRICHELANGPVPEDHHVHHRTEDPIHCIGRPCGNPEHTLAVTPQEHIVELTPGSASNIAAHRDHCAKGHLYTEENTRRDGEGRHCRTCEMEYARDARDRARLAEGREKFRWKQENKKTHCHRGHLLQPPNLYWQGKYASCLECRRINNQLLTERRRAKAVS